MKKTGAVVVAAGLSSRMGEFKPMLPFGGSTVSRYLAELLKGVGADPIVFVTGYRAEELECHLSGMGVRFVKNERFRETQMFDSVRLGIKAVLGECSRVMVMPVDLPAIMPETFRRLMQMDVPMARTVCRGVPGHPVLLNRDTAELLCGYEGPGGLRGAMEKSGIPVVSLEVDDVGIYRDMDTKEEYLELLKLNADRSKAKETGGADL